MNKKVILLVEDNADDIELTLHAFEQCKVLNEIVVAHDGDEALRCLLQGRFPDGKCFTALPAVVLLDLKLPKLSGLQLLKEIRANSQLRRLPIVILTSSKEEQDRAASYDLGVNSYVRKPVDFEQFAYAVRELGLYWLLLNEEPPLVVTKPDA